MTEHPYFPKSLLMPNYVPNESSVIELLGIFFGIVLVIMVIFWLYLRQRYRFSSIDKIKFTWFLVCGFIHSILEGHFSLYHSSLVGESSYLAQMWKEYGKGDSRYVTSDTCIVGVETITAFIDGPLCFLTVGAFLTGSPYRYAFQLITSLCQLYGDSMYFFTEIKEDFIHSDVGHPLYFWFYMIFLNSFWIIIPLIMIVDSTINIVHAQTTCDNTKQRKQTNSTSNDRKKKK